MKKVLLSLLLILVAVTMVPSVHAADLLFKASDFVGNYTFLFTGEEGDFTLRPVRVLGKLFSDGIGKIKGERTRYTIDQRTGQWTSSNHTFECEYNLKKTCLGQTILVTCNVYTPTIGGPCSAGSTSLEQWKGRFVSKREILVVVTEKGGGYLLSGSALMQ
ncbi:MAG: hypothetical protein JSV14_06465 [Deltaproteobacteria bacterium]|nr:MAG: hypothetical protein JSV14_06465 [Deltaproteobacteria bacterium]